MSSQLASLNLPEPYIADQATAEQAQTIMFYLPEPRALVCHNDIVRI